MPSSYSSRSVYYFSSLMDSLSSSASFLSSQICNFTEYCSFLRFCVSFSFSVLIWNKREGYLFELGDLSLLPGGHLLDLLLKELIDCAILDLLLRQHVLLPVEVLQFVARRLQFDGRVIFRSVSIRVVRRRLPHQDLLAEWHRLLGGQLRRVLRVVLIASDYLLLRRCLGFWPIHYFINHFINQYYSLCINILCCRIANLPFCNSYTKLNRVLTSAQFRFNRMRL